MSRDENAIRMLAAFAAGCIVYSSLPPLVRAGPALLLVLYLPGAGIVGAVFGRALPALEAAVLSVGLSFASCGLSALILNSVHALNSSGWAIALTSVSLVSSFVGFLQATTHDKDIGPQ